MVRTKEEIGRVILSLLKDRKMSQLDLATATGKDKGTINKVIKGKSEMELETLWKITRALSVSIYEIVGEAPDPTLFDAAKFLGAFEKATLEARRIALLALERGRRAEGAQSQAKGQPKGS